MGNAEPATAATRADEGSLRDRLAYLVVLSRPRFWSYLAGPVVVGVTVAADTVGGLFTPTTLLLLAYFLFPGNVLLYGVNDLFDADVDAENPKKEGREARWSGDRVVLGVVVGAGLLGTGTFAVTPRVAWPWLAGFFLLAVGYSAPPARFKTTPLADSVSNGLYVLPGAAAYAAVAGGHPPAAAVVGAWLWTMGMHTFSAIPDIEPDREAGIRTTATVLGEEHSYAYCAGCWLLSAVAFAFADARLGAVLLAYPVVVFLIYWSDVAVDRAYWWYPALNTLVGMLITLAALWEMVPPVEVLP